MKISDSQYGVLSSLSQHGPATAIEVIGPPGMDGKRKIKLQWNCAPGPTLAKLEAEKLVAVARVDAGRPVSAVGKSGHRRINLTISISEAGRKALDSA